MKCSDSSIRGSQLADLAVTYLRTANSGTAKLRTANLLSSGLPTENLPVGNPPAAHRISGSGYSSVPAMIFSRRVRRIFPLQGSTPSALFSFLHLFFLFFLFFMSAMPVSFHPLYAEASSNGSGEADSSLEPNTGSRQSDTSPQSGAEPGPVSNKEKALEILEKQLKEMQQKVEFPVGIHNRLLEENRTAYDKQDLVALAGALLSRKQLYGIAIWKSKHRLSVFDQRGVVLLSFEAGIGGDSEGGLKPKKLEYDGRTPEGIYRIFRFYSLDADKKTESYKELQRLNGYYLTAKLGYSLYGKPGKDAGKNVFGPRFYGIDYPAASDVVRYKASLKAGKIPEDKKGKLPMRIGSGIAIHGTNDPASVGKTFGSGCIRLRNEEIIQLDPFMSPGMPVVIFP